MADRLEETTTELLDLSKMESGESINEKEDFDLQPLVDDIAKGFRLLTDQKGVKLITDYQVQNVPVHADRKKISRVMLNLFSNAVKFTSEGHVGVALKRENGHVLCSVSNTGKGIDADDLPKLFNKYQQLSNSKGKKGTGLGLSIAKQIITLHGGKIWAESEPNKITHFNFTLPIEA